MLLCALAAAGEPVIAVGQAPGRRDDRRGAPPRLSIAAAVRASLLPPGRLAIWLTVPDDVLALVAEEVAELLAADRPDRPGDGVVMIHTSGRHSLSVLAPAAAAGAGTLCLHPLQSFAPGQDERALRGVPVAVTAGDAATHETGERLAALLGGRPFSLADEAKPVYHLAAVMASNLLVALQVQAADLMREATESSLEEATEHLRRLVTTTLANVHDGGYSHALTGPVARGDVGTVRAHLELLRERAPLYASAYRSLSLEALSLAAPRLDDDTIRALHEVLGDYPGRVGDLP